MERKIWSELAFREGHLIRGKTMFETTIEKFILFSVTSIGVIFFLLYVKIQKLYQQERKKNDL